MPFLGAAAKPNIAKAGMLPANNVAAATIHIFFTVNYLSIEAYGESSTSGATASQ